MLEARLFARHDLGEAAVAFASHALRDGKPPWPRAVAPGRVRHLRM
jgi:hypothetical protein